VTRHRYDTNLRYPSACLSIHENDEGRPKTDPHDVACGEDQIMLIHDDDDDDDDAMRSAVHDRLQRSESSSTWAMIERNGQSYVR
jgi:hypothetical protein